jgi:hypothetical protein
MTTVFTSFLRCSHRFFTKLLDEVAESASVTNALAVKAQAATSLTSVKRPPDLKQNVRPHAHLPSPLDIPRCPRGSRSSFSFLTSTYDIQTYSRRHLSPYTLLHASTSAPPRPSGAPLCAAISCGTLDIMKLEQTGFINGNTKPFVPENPLLFILTSVP